MNIGEFAGSMSEKDPRFQLSGTSGCILILYLTLYLTIFTCCK